MKALFGVVVLVLSGCGDQESPVTSPAPVSTTLAPQVGQTSAPKSYQWSRQDGARLFTETFAALNGSFHALNSNSDESPCPPFHFSVRGEEVSIHTPIFQTPDSVIYRSDTGQYAVKTVAADVGIMALGWRESAALSVLDRAKKTAAPKILESSISGACGLRTIVSDFVGETSLADIVPGSLGTEEVNRLGIALLSLLEEVHSIGLVHGDMHAGNVVTNGSEVKLIDFGRARVFIDPVSGQHIPFTYSDEELDFNPMLLSLHELEGWMPSRRDDLFRLAELLAFLVDGDECLYIHRTIRGRRVTLIPPQREIIKRKRFRIFSSQVPAGVVQLYNAATVMAFDQDPDYESLRALFPDDANPV